MVWYQGKSNNTNIFFFVSEKYKIKPSILFLWQQNPLNLTSYGQFYDFADFKPTNG